VRRHLSLAAIAAIAVVAVSGCSGGLHSDAPLPQAYALRAAPVPAALARAEQAASLRVMRPYAAPGLDTDRIMLLQSDRRLSYYASSRWAAALPDVVEVLAVDTLRASASWSAVEDSHSSFVADYYLQITIRRFEADTTEGAGGPVVHVRLSCMLGRGADHELIAAFPAEGSATAAQNRLGAVVAAFEQAANAALAAASAGASEALRTSRSPSPPAAGKPSS
jgi:cholesterol transport system auxiliary component